MAFDKDKPAASTSLKVSNPEILTNNTALQDAIAKNHQFEGTVPGTQTGRHEAIELLEQADLGTGAEGVPILGAKTVVKPELVFTNEDDADIQITSGTSLGSATTPILAASIDIGSTVVVVGTLDDDTMGTATDTTISTSESIKAYVDTATYGGAPTSLDADGASLAKTTVYQAQTSGFVTAWSTNHSATQTQGLIGATSSPATLVAWNDSAGSEQIAAFIMFLVPKDFYFQITQSAGVTVMWTPLTTGGGAPTK